MQNRFHVPVMWGLNNFIKDIVAYIYVEVALCLRDRELNTFIKDSGFIWQNIYKYYSTCS